MSRTLYGKLVAALLVLIAFIGVSYVVLSAVTTRLLFQEVNQTLNRSLAANVVKDQWLMRGRDINEPAFKDLFDRLMDVNPGIEMYLVDPAGEIVAFSAPPGKVKRQTISLEPVSAFIEGRRELPIRGDDPRDEVRQKIFSAAPVYDGDRLAGYLYVVLGGEAFDSAVQVIQGSYILRLSVGIGVAGLLLALVVGLVSFNWLTRRLRRLAGVMDGFKEDGFQRSVSLGAWRRDLGGDEIDRLGLGFEQMSRRITDQIKQLQHADASRRELVASISHDLRTPLASLQGYLETLVMKQHQLTEEERDRYLHLALEHGHRLGRLIDELFELSRLDAGDPRLHFEPFSMGELVQDVSQKFRLEAERKRLALETEIPPDAPFVSGDIGLIERVLENLIENAIKYTPRGGTITLSLVPGPNRITARVSDTGRGIPEDALPRVFERFYRVEQADPDVAEGTGLGLAIARRILELHGSPIRVDSRVGVGTTFTFDLAVAGH
ncbi:MAG: sensor histidine kinase [Alphaproteobacteria bacterium]